jgi:hypothetical protein
MCGLNSSLLGALGYSAGRLASYTNQSYAVGSPVPRSPKHWDNEDY